MANGQQLDTDKIVDSIRDSLWKRWQELSPEEIASALPNGQGNRDLASLQSYYDIYNIRFTSHRHLLGWPIILAKKLLRKLLTPILERQISYNSANTRIVSTLWERSGVIGQQQGAALRALRTEITKQQATALQTLRTEMTKQQETALRALRTEITEQQATALQTLRTEMTEQIEKMGQQRAAAFQAFREVVVGQVERLGQQHDSAMDTLRQMVVGQVERLGQQHDTAMDTLRDMVVGQVEQLGQQQTTAMQALRDMLVGQVEQMGQRYDTAMDTLRDMVGGQVEQLAQQKAQLIRQERRITMLLEEARKRLPEPFTEEALQIMRAEGERSLDALYVSFEDQFRGTREDIKARCRVYLPLLKEAGLGTDERPILDLGCGRGEWLEVLQEEGLQARGLDLNAVLVEECRERGFEVVEGDLITYLRALPDASVGMVTGFHIIEHLPFDVLIALLDETVRVLQPGGLAIFETPNPQNVLVGSCNFYIDPTHRHPLHSHMMQFLAEAKGFCNVEILYLHPSEISPLPETTEVAKRFNEYFYGPMDYAIVGRRV